MPSRVPELYKDKIEVSLDGRQIFYLFFGGAVIVGLVFVLGVTIGRRVEARGHLDRAEIQAARDPLAALDRLDGSDNLSFHGAIAGSEAPTDVEKAIASANAVTSGDGKPGKPEVKPEVKPEARADKLEGRGEPVTRPEVDKPKADKHDGEKQSKKHADDPGAKPDIRTDARPETKTDGKPSAKTGGEGRGKFTLQLSSFQDRSEAEALLATIKLAGYDPYLTEANVSGKGTFYRVRLGSYRTLEAANDAKDSYERAMRKTVQVMRL